MGMSAMVEEWKGNCYQKKFCAGRSEGMELEVGWRTRGELMSVSEVCRLAIIIVTYVTVPYLPSSPQIGERAAPLHDVTASTMAIILELSRSLYTEKSMSSAFYC